MSGRKGIHAAGYVSTSPEGPDNTIVRSWVTDGPADAKGRMAYLHLEDAEVRQILAELAARPRWAAALVAAAGNKLVQAAAGGTVYMGGGRNLRAEVTAVMEQAMREADAGEAG